jgi:ABC-type antimicrobial peptide transport system permease subunit
MLFLKKFNTGTEVKKFFNTKMSNKNLIGKLLYEDDDDDNDEDNNNVDNNNNDDDDEDDGDTHFGLGFTSSPITKVSNNSNNNNNKRVSDKKGSGLVWNEESLVKSFIDFLNVIKVCFFFAFLFLTIIYEFIFVFLLHFITCALVYS